ncbi:MAG TPA: restriction endonuclease [Thermoanaerobaculia bacterium]|nr:restriction endonuclease [Thermoanaerobaculia bacterium]
MLFLFAGTAGAGMTPLVRELGQSNGFRLVPKMTTRALRPYEDTPELESVDPSRILPDKCDIIYTRGGNYYGIDTQQIEALLSTSAHVILQISDLENLQILKTKFGSRAKTVWVGLDIERLRSNWKSRNEDDVDIRVRKLLESRASYDSNRDLFDFTIIGTESTEGVLSQFEALVSTLYAEPSLIYQSESVGHQGGLIEAQLLLANQEIKSFLAHHPDLLYKLSPRDFEVFIAEIMKDLGYTVELTPRTRDGGFDIRLIHFGALGPWLCLVECKRYSPDNPVGVELVRSLHGVRDIERANAAALVTTSYFTLGAIELQRRLGYQLSLHDFDCLKLWLERYTVG